MGPTEYVYVLQRLLEVEDDEDPVPYERKRATSERLSEEDIKSWVREDFENLVERRSDVKNILATRVVRLRGQKGGKTYTADAVYVIG